MTDERDPDLDALIRAEINDLRMAANDLRMAANDLRMAANTLAAKARNLVELLDEEEKYHGGLVRVETLKAKNELRLALSRWN